jgi:hypothetical protein
MFEQFVESIEQTCSNPNNVEIIAYVDEDDKASQAQAYKCTIQIVRVIGARHTSTPLRYNTALQAASGPIIWMLNDDVLFRTQAWDKCLLQSLPRHNLYCTFPLDGVANRCSFPLVSHRWILTVGYMLPVCIHHNFAETWVEDIAGRAGLLMGPLPIMCEHLHPLVQKRKWDNLDADNFGTNNAKYAEDKLTFFSAEAVAMRESAAERLRKYIPPTYA